MSTVASAMTPSSMSTPMNCSCGASAESRATRPASAHPRSMVIPGRSAASAPPTAARSRAGDVRCRCSRVRRCRLGRRGYVIVFPRRREPAEGGLPAAHRDPDESPVGRDVASGDRQPECLPLADQQTCAGEAVGDDVLHGGATADGYAVEKVCPPAVVVGGDDEMAGGVTVDDVAHRHRGELGGAVGMSGGGFGDGHGVSLVVQAMAWISMSNPSMGSVVMVVVRAGRPRPPATLPRKYW